MAILLDAIIRGWLLGSEFLSSFSDTRGEDFENVFSIFPAYASVCDGDAVLQAGFALFGDFLSACM